MHRQHAGIQYTIYLHAHRSAAIVVQDIKIPEHEAHITTILLLLLLLLLARKVDSS